VDVERKKRKKNSALCRRRQGEVPHFFRGKVKRKFGGRGGDGRFFPRRKGRGGGGKRSTTPRKSKKGEFGRETKKKASFNVNGANLIFSRGEKKGSRKLGGREAKGQIFVGPLADTRERRGMEEGEPLSSVMTLIDEGILTFSKRKEGPC